MGLKLLLAAIFLFCTSIGAEGAQICGDDIAATAPDSRFEANGDGTVTDLTTGLIWKQCAEGVSGPGCATGSAQTFTWQTALQYAADNPPWRLPNKNELASLVERRCYDPAINATFFPNTPPSGFWSASPYAGVSSYAWLVHFEDGSVSDGSKNYGNYVRLLLGGQ